MFFSFPKGDAKENYFLHAQAHLWPGVKIYARIRNEKGPEKVFRELQAC